MPGKILQTSAHGPPAFRPQLNFGPLSFFLSFNQSHQNRQITRRMRKRDVTLPWRSASHMRIVKCHGRRAAPEVPTLKAFPGTASRRGVESLNLDIFRVIAFWCYVIVCVYSQERTWSMQHIFFSDDFSEYHKSYVYSIKWLRHWLSVKSTALMTRRPCSTTAVRLDSTTKFNVACGHCHLYPMNGNIAISAGFLFCCGGKHLILDLKQRDKNQVL